jgi:hypothetical protein
MSRFQSTWTRFELRKPRHPLLRVFLGLVGIGVLALLVVGGLFVGLAMLLAAAVWRLGAGLLRRSRPAGAADDVIDGEYTVVRKHHPPLASR